jgi:hypothetical protein
MVGWILFIFGIQEFIHHRSVLGEYKHSSSKYRDPSQEPQNKVAMFLKVAVAIVIKFQ